MKLPLHVAFVEEVPSPNFDGPDSWGYRAICEETGIACDAFGFTREEGGINETEAEAMESAVEYLGDSRLHLLDSPHFCNARHVLEMGHPQ